MQSLKESFGGAKLAGGMTEIKEKAKDLASDVSTEIFSSCSSEGGEDPLTTSKARQDPFEICDGLATVRVAFWH